MNRKWWACGLVFGLLLTVPFASAAPTFTKISNPSGLPTGMGRGAEFSPDGAFFAVAHSTTPFITIYGVSGTTFTQLSGPGTGPTGTSYDVSWNHDGTLLAVAHDTTPFISIFQRSGSTFTKIANPGILPTGNARSLDFTPDGSHLAVAHFTSPYMTVYEVSGAIFTKLSDPATLPGGTLVGAAWSTVEDVVAFGSGNPGDPCIILYQLTGPILTKLTNPATQCASIGTSGKAAWSPEGDILAVPSSTTPFVLFYETAGFTKLSDPASIPGGSSTKAGWSPDGNFVTFSNSVTPFVFNYERSGSTFTKLANPGTLPTGSGAGVAWAPGGEWLAISHGITPFLTIYAVDPPAGLPAPAAADGAQVGCSTFALNWSVPANFPNISSYRVYRNSSLYPINRTFTVPPEGNFTLRLLNDTFPKISAPLAYRVVGVNASGGASPDSNFVNFTPANVSSVGDCGLAFGGMSESEFLEAAGLTGASEDALGILLSIILVLVGAAVGFAVMSAGGAVVGAGAGMLLSVGFGYLPLWAIMFVLVLLAGGFFLSKPGAGRGRRKR